MMERTFKAVKGIGTVAIASFTLVSFPLANPSVETSEIEPQVNFVVFKALTEINREIDMNLENTNYIHDLRKFYD